MDQSHRPVDWSNEILSNTPEHKRLRSLSDQGLQRKCGSSRHRRTGRFRKGIQLSLVLGRYRKGDPRHLFNLHKMPGD